METTAVPRLPAVWTDGREDDLVLVIDDSAPLRALFTHTLRHEGYRTVCAEHGREALALVPHVAPVLIILDLAMPNLDGWGFLAELRRASRDVPPVILTSGILELPKEAARLGVAGFLPKPFTKHALVRLVHAHARSAPAHPTARLGILPRPWRECKPTPPPIWPTRKATDR